LLIFQAAPFGIFVAFPGCGRAVMYVITFDRAPGVIADSTAKRKQCAAKIF